MDWGVRFSGCTVHFVAAEVDMGPIILQAAVPVLQDDTEDTLAARILVEEHRIYPEAVGLYFRGAARGPGPARLHPRSRGLRRPAGPEMRMTVRTGWPGRAAAIAALIAVFAGTWVALDRTERPARLARRRSPGRRGRRPNASRSASPSRGPSKPAWIDCTLHRANAERRGWGYLASSGPARAAAGGRTYSFVFTVPEREDTAVAFALVFLSPTGRWQDGTRAVTTRYMPVSRAGASPADLALRKTRTYRYPTAAEAAAQAASEGERRPRGRPAAWVHPALAALLLAAAALCLARAGRTGSRGTGGGRADALARVRGRTRPGRRPGAQRAGRSRGGVGPPAGRRDERLRVPEAVPEGGHGRRGRGVPGALPPLYKGGPETGPAPVPVVGRTRPRRVPGRVVRQRALVPRRRRRPGHALARRLARRRGPRRGGAGDAARGGLRPGPGERCRDYLRILGGAIFGARP
ncbi:MAG: hypothetical protein M0C28_42975 [Candidatus Moduliflexus flocculans]|nr:hypothetical protein [Candidatus Moduliflexus flocculans]